MFNAMQFAGFCLLFVPMACQEPAQLERPKLDSEVELEACNHACRQAGERMKRFQRVPHGAGEWGPSVAFEIVCECDRP